MKLVEHGGEGRGARLAGSVDEVRPQRHRPKLRVLFVQGPFGPPLGRQERVGDDRGLVANREEDECSSPGLDGFVRGKQDRFCIHPIKRHILLGALSDCCDGMDHGVGAVEQIAPGVGGKDVRSPPMDLLGPGVSGRGKGGTTAATEGGHLMAVLHRNAANFGSDEAVTSGNDEGSHGTRGRAMRRWANEGVRNARGSGIDGLPVQRKSDGSGEFQGRTSGRQFSVQFPNESSGCRETPQTLRELNDHIPFVSFCTSDLRLPMFDDILVACDFSPASERALAYAVDLVDRTGATLHLMHVQEVALGPFVGGEPSPEAGQKDLLDQFRARCRERLSALPHAPGDEQISYVVERSGAVAPALVEAAAEEPMDLIVMGTHGRRGVQRVVSGSVAEEVLRTAPCPVLTVRAEEEEQELGPVSVEQLVVPIDFSDPSREALGYAARLTAVYEVPIALVHVVQLPTLPSVYDAELSDLSTEEIEAQVREELKEWERTVASAAEEVSVAVLNGDPVSAILEAASTPEDLVVMATQGRSGLKRQVLGSVAEGVLRRAPGPVITGRTFPEP